MKAGLDSCEKISIGKRLGRPRWSAFTHYRQCTHYERAPCLRRQSGSATHACGGFAPTPPGFSALVPLPIGSFTGPDSGRGTQEHPPVSVEATESALGVFAAGSGSMTLDLGGSGPSEESLSPQGGTQHAE
jgi:hypothetical protein